MTPSRKKKGTKPRGVAFRNSGGSLNIQIEGKRKGEIMEVAGELGVAQEQRSRGNGGPLRDEKGVLKERSR